MDYREFLEHMQTLLAAQKRSIREIGRDNLLQPLYAEAHISEVIESEIQNEKARGELALIISESAPPQDILEKSDRARRALTEHQTATETALKLTEDPFRCTQCGEPIMYGERQHVCRGAK